MTTFDTGNGRAYYDKATHKVVAKDAIVLNPDSVVVWGFLKDHEVDSPGAPRCDALAQEIRKQLPASKMAEPTDVGSVVHAAQVGEIEGSVRAWVRFRRYGKDCWIDSLEHVRSWDDLDNPAVPS